MELKTLKSQAALYTSKPELERSGMGFTVMETFMDGWRWSLHLDQDPCETSKISGQFCRRTSEKMDTFERRGIMRKRKPIQYVKHTNMRKTVTQKQRI